MALGASVMLGGATGARAGDLAGLFNATQSAASFPPWAQFFQHIPQNWSELPVRFNLSEAVEYNSNARLLPPTPLFGKPPSLSAPSSPNPQ